MTQNRLLKHEKVTKKNINIVGSIKIENVRSSKNKNATKFKSMRYSWGKKCLQ